MICFLALIVFSILGIFSISYRKLALTAFDCVFRRVTFRPCQAGMDRKLRNRLVGLISRKNVKLAGLVVKHFEFISWIFTFLLIASIFFSARGIYFYVMYGNCNGQESDEFCIFDALHPGEEASCTDPSLIQSNDNFIKPGPDDDPFIGPEDAKVTIIEFGCYACPYTKKAEPVVKEILRKYDGKVKYVFRDFPLPSHNNSWTWALAPECAGEKYWKLHGALFDNQEKLSSEEDLVALAEEIGLDTDGFRECLRSAESADEVEKDFEDGKNAGVYGTPTFFINDEVVVGPKPFRYFKNIIDGELKK
ncbi:DsbA family protein [Candidatus Woesearchaeota archaeon]|nr:DsbA family protein [Candidatus Woesearchaeota archaeon]